MGRPGTLQVVWLPGRLWGADRSWFAPRASTRPFAHPSPAPAGYVLGPLLGKGGFCSVRKALYLLTGQAVACKIIEKGKLKVGEAGG